MSEYFGFWFTRFFCISFLVFSLFSNVWVAAKNFGSAISLKDPISLTQALAATKGKAQNDSEVLIEGTVQTVCKKKGCWLTLKDSENEIRVTFKDYGFFVPKDAGSLRILAQGVFVQKTESVEDQKHFLKDAGAKDFEIKAVTKEKMSTSFVASGISLIGKE